jgi:tetratricopeptide (TPR) repeat protein
MDQEKPQREFFENEIMLKLYKGFDRSDYEGRISFVKEEAEKVREFFEADIFEKNLNSFIAHCYLDAEEYGKAIPYFEKLIGHEDPNDPNSYFFFKRQILIRCYWRTNDFSTAYSLLDQTFSHLHKANSFDKLNMLVEYVDYLEASKKDFDERYLQFIEDVRTDLGFGILEGSPLEKVYSMKKANIKWNRKLGEIILYKEKNLAKALILFQAYYDECEIGWYRNYVSGIIAKMKQETAP